MSRERTIVEQAVERIEYSAVDLRQWVDEVHEEIEEARERCAEALDTLTDLAAELGDASDGATPEAVARWRAVVERACDLLRQP